MNYFVNWNQHAGSGTEKFYKTTLWQGDHLLVGLNCLEPNQKQPTHAHQGADKFYFVLEGRGTFTVGSDERDAEAGTLVALPREFHTGSPTAARPACRFWSRSRLHPANERN